MSKFLMLRLNRFVPFGLIALATAVLLAPAPANATPYVVKLVQLGSNVVATGSGEFDLTGLTFYGTLGSSNAVGPNYGYVGTGIDGSAVDGYKGRRDQRLSGAEVSLTPRPGPGIMPHSMPLVLVRRCFSCRRAMFPAPPSRTVRLGTTPASPVSA